MGNQTGKLMAAQKAYGAAGKNMKAASGSGSAKLNDEQLDEKRKDRGYDPTNDAERGNTSQKLNEDSARYRKGPGPL